MSYRALVILLVLPASAWAQGTPEPLKGADRQTYQNLKQLREPVEAPGDPSKTAANRAILERQAKYMVGQLLDNRRIQADTLAGVIEDAISTDLPVIRTNRPKVIKDDYLAFSREMGAALVKELEPALKSPKTVVRMNAARLLSVLGMIGYDKAVAPALAILNDEKENGAVKFWALRTLHETLAFEVDAGLPEQSVFRRENRSLEHESIVALEKFVTTPRDVAGLSPEEIAGITYVRREAVRALSFARTPRLRFEGRVLARPALTLLRVANRDGLVPEPGVAERAAAVEGVTRLFPVVRTNADRDVQGDYLAFALGAAALDLATVKLNVPTDISIPWRTYGDRWEVGFQTLAANAASMSLDGAAALKELSTRAAADLFGPIKAANVNQPINAADFRGWLTGNPPQAKSLYKDEPQSTINPAGLK